MSSLINCCLTYDNIRIACERILSQGVTAVYVSMLIISYLLCAILTYQHESLFSMPKTDPLALRQNDVSAFQFLEIATTKHLAIAP